MAVFGKLGIYYSMVIHKLRVILIENTFWIIIFLILNLKASMSSFSFLPTNKITLLFLHPFSPKDN